MTPHRALLVLAATALVIAVVALVLALLVMQQSGRTLATVRRHRIAHRRTTGHADPERRGPDVGPPPGQDDRRTPITPPRVIPQRRCDMGPCDERCSDTRCRAEDDDTATAEHPAPTTTYRRPPPPLPPHPHRRRSDLA